jgi:uncharacterized protein (TIGR01777 family)
LTGALRKAGEVPVALVRREPLAGEVHWDPTAPLAAEKLAGCDAVVHLAGKNVAGHWTEQFKRELLESRVQGTRTLATAAAESFRRTGRPSVFVSASGGGYYGDRGDELLTEESPAGSGFLAEICKQWEAATAPACEAGVRVVCLRIGVVLGREGGALKPLLLPFRLGLGGRIGNGRQYWSWIALEDVIGAIQFALHNESVRGPINVVAPSAVRNQEFVRALGEALHRPTIFPLPEFAIRTLLGEMGKELLLTSTRMQPAKLEACGYCFRRAELSQALHAALHVTPS